MSRRLNYGFTFIEMIFVIVIIGVLAAIAIPAYVNYTGSTRVSEGLMLAQPLREKIEEYYAHHGRFPRDNRALSENRPSALFSDSIEAIEVRDGAIHLHFRDDRAATLRGGVLSLRPTVSATQPDAPLVWICAQKSAVGRIAAGEDRTDLDESVLRSTCRKWEEPK